MKRPTPAPKEQEDETEVEDAVVKDELGGEIPVLRWSARRKMAWRAFTALIIMTVIYWFGLPLWFFYWNLPTTWLTIIGDSYFWFATSMGVVVMSYMGIRTFPFWNKGGSKKDPEEEA